MSPLLLFRVCLITLFFAWAQPSSAAPPLTVKLYWPENLDQQRKQIPLTKRIIAIFDYFQREAGLKFVIVNLPWKRAQLEVLQGKGIIYGFSKTSERLDLYRFSEAVITLNIWAISHGPANLRIAEVKDLQGKVITTGLGLSHGIEYEQARNTVFTLREDFATDRDRYRRLMSKQSDVVLYPAVQQESHEDVMASVRTVVVPSFNDPAFIGAHFDVSSKPIFFDTTHFASSKGHFAEVMNRIDKAVQTGIKNGSLPKLLSKYK